MSTSSTPKLRLLVASMMLALLSYGFVGFNPYPSAAGRNIPPVAKPFLPMKSCGSGSILTDLHECAIMNDRHALIRSPKIGTLVGYVTWKLLRSSDTRRVWALRKKQNDWKIWAYIHEPMQNVEHAITACSDLNQTLGYRGVHFHVPNREQVDDAIALGLLETGNRNAAVLSNVFEGDSYSWIYSARQAKWYKVEASESLRGLYCVSSLGNSPNDDYEQNQAIRKTDLEFEMAFGEFPLPGLGTRTDFHFLK